MFVPLTLRKKINDWFFFPSTETVKNSFITALWIKKFDLEIQEVAVIVSLSEAIKSHWIIKKKKKSRSVWKWLCRLVSSYHWRKMSRQETETGNVGHTVS